MVLLKLFFYLLLFVGLLSASAEKEAPDRKQHHIAIVTGCDSHMSVTKPIAYTLLNKVSDLSKYRITYVTGEQCRDTALKLGAQHHNTGVWYYPNMDPKCGIYEYYRNLTVGSVLYSYHSVVSLIKADKPDLILAEGFGVGAATAAEEYDVPFAFLWTPGVPPMAVWNGDNDLNCAYVLRQFANFDLDNKWLKKYTTTMYFSIFIALQEPFAKPGILELEKIRDRIGLPNFDGYVHLSNCYPQIVMAGYPVTEMRETLPHLMVTGMLPSPPETATIESEVTRFLENSNKPILYVALGTYASYSNETFVQVKEALESQDYFNVMWSHRFYDGKIFPVSDKKKMLIKKTMPQKQILNHERVKVFLSHCGMSSITEGISSGVAFLTSPQGRDQFYLANRLKKIGAAHYLGPTPTRETVLEAVEVMHKNLDTFTANSVTAYRESSKGSVEKLERFVDELIKEKHVRVFDLDESLVWSLRQSILVIFLSFLPIFFLMVLVSYVCICTGRALCCNTKKEQNKQKRS